jgi:hypothetical protein
VSNDAEKVSKISSLIGGMLYNDVLPYFRVDPELFLEDVEVASFVEACADEILTQTKQKGGDV